MVLCMALNMAQDMVLAMEQDMDTLTLFMELGTDLELDIVMEIEIVFS